MPLYAYKGYDTASGQAISGKVEADSERSARQRIRQKHKMIIASIKEEASAASKSKVTLFQPRVQLNELAIMVKQFAVLQQAHVPLDESLTALIAQVDNPVLRNTLSAVKDGVSEGMSLADASSKYPRVFNRLYVNMVRAGESSGTLATVLVRLADFFEYQVKVSRQVISAMTYPAIMICASGGIVAFMMVSVVPNLAKVFDNLKVPLPWFTKTLIGVSEFVQSFWYVIILLAVCAVFGFRSWIQKEKGRRKFDQIILKTPLFGGIALRMNISRFTKTLSTLLSSGVPIIQAIDITKNVVTNSVIADVLEQAKVEVQEGKSLASCIARSGIFPGLVTHMIATGEKTGELEQMLVHVANAYDAEAESKISTMIALIEPLMMLVMLGITLVVIGAMMLPMLSVMNSIR